MERANALGSSGRRQVPGTIEHVVMVPRAKTTSSCEIIAYDEEISPDGADPPDSPNPPTPNRH